MSRQPHLLHRAIAQVLRYSWRTIALLIAALITLTPVTLANAQSRSPQVRRDRRPTREVTIHYPASTPDDGRYIHRGGTVPVFRPGPSSSTTWPNLSDESGWSNDTPGGFRPR